MLRFCSSLIMMLSFMASEPSQASSWRHWLTGEKGHIDDCDDLVARKRIVGRLSVAPQEGNEPRKVIILPPESSIERPKPPPIIMPPVVSQPRTQQPVEASKPFASAVSSSASSVKLTPPPPSLLSAPHPHAQADEKPTEKASDRVAEEVPRWKIEMEERKAREAERKKEEEARKALESAQRKKEYEEFFSQSSERVSEITDFLNYEQFKSKIQPVWSIGLYVGSPTTKMNAELEDFLKEKVKYILSKKYFIVYDADSATAPVISKLAGESAVGISAGSPQSGLGRVIVVKNPYLRLLFLEKPDKVASGLDSPIGLALAVNGSVDYFVSKDDNQKKVLLSRWQPKKEEGLELGLNFSDVSIMELETRFTKTLDWQDVAAYLADLLKFDAESKMKDAKKHADIYLEVKAQLLERAANDGNGEYNGFGALVIGSGSYPGRFTQPLYQIVRLLSDQGVAISTGGAGGVMEIGNQAAFDSGGDSIGIGLGGKLSSERKSLSQIQTLTFEVDDYRQRIPLLLLNKKIVIVGPGGKGTMKEIATFILEDLADNQSRLVVFVGTDYYKNFFNDIKAVLPHSVSQHYYLVDSREEFEKILDIYKSKKWSKGDIHQISSWVPFEPRNNSQNFIERVKPAKPESPKVKPYQHKGSKP